MVSPKRVAWWLTFGSSHEIPGFVKLLMPPQQNWGISYVRFRCADTESIFHGDRVTSFQLAVQKVARRKLRVLDAAQELKDLRVPPANRLEKLKGDRVGQHSIRVNNQYRICFVWNAGKASRVEIVDYH